ncbi:MAG: hypothetical protein ABIG20_02650 [archaeon]
MAEGATVYEQAQNALDSTRANQYLSGAPDIVKSVEERYVAKWLNFIEQRPTIIPKAAKFVYGIRKMEAQLLYDYGMRNYETVSGNILDRWAHMPNDAWRTEEIKGAEWTSLDTAITSLKLSKEKWIEIRDWLTETMKKAKEHKVELGFPVDRGAFDRQIQVVDKQIESVKKYKKDLTKGIVS